MFFLVALIGLAAASVTDCDTTSLFRPTHLGLSPDPPVRGKPVYLTVQFTNPGAEITNGTVTTSLSINFIPFQPTTEGLCVDTTCPIPTGPIDRSTESTWPDTVSGQIISKSHWYDPTGASLLCVQINVKVA
jgi:hypothetical protein